MTYDVFIDESAHLNGCRCGWEISDGAQWIGHTRDPWIACCKLTENVMAAAEKGVATMALPHQIGGYSWLHATHLRVARCRFYLGGTAGLSDVAQSGAIYCTLRS